MNLTQIQKFRRQTQAPCKATSESSFSEGGSLGEVGTPATEFVEVRLTRISNQLPHNPKT